MSWAWARKQDKERESSGISSSWSTPPGWQLEELSVPAVTFPSDRVIRSRSVRQRQLKVASNYKWSKATHKDSCYLLCPDITFLSNFLRLFYGMFLLALDLVSTCTLACHSQRKMFCLTYLCNCSLSFKAQSRASVNDKCMKEWMNKWTNKYTPS